MDEDIFEEVTEEIQESNDIQQETNEESNDTNDIFDPNSLEFEESYELEGYDLSKYKDSIDIDSKEVQAKAKKFKELGFSQEQIEYYLEDTMQVPESDREPTAQEVRERLNKTLTPAEKRNYKAVSNFVIEGLKGTELEQYSTEAMKNPTLVKMFNALYNKANNNGVKADTPVTKREVAKGKISLGDAREKYREWMTTAEVRTPEKRIEFLNNMIKNSGNEEELAKAFEDLLKA